MFWGGLRGDTFKGPEFWAVGGSSGQVLRKYGYNGVLQWEYSAPSSPTFRSPAVDDQGRVYVGATDGFVRRLLPDGSLDWAYDNGGSIGGIAANNDGSCWLSDVATIKRLDDDGEQVWSSAIDGLRRITPMQADGDENAYVVRSTGIYRLNSAGDVSAVVLGGEFGTGTVIAVDSGGNIYAGGPSSTVVKINPAGDIVLTIPGTLGVQSLAVDAEGLIYRGGQDESIRVFNQAGSQVLARSLASAVGSVAVDRDRNIYGGVLAGVRKRSPTGITMLSVAFPAANAGVEAAPGRFTVAGHDE